MCSVHIDHMKLRILDKDSHDVYFRFLFSIVEHKLNRKTFSMDARKKRMKKKR